MPTCILFWGLSDNVKKSPTLSRPLFLDILGFLDTFYLTDFVSKISSFMILFPLKRMLPLDVNSDRTPYILLQFLVIFHNYSDSIWK